MSTKSSGVHSPWPSNPTDSEISWPSFPPTIRMGLIAGWGPDELVSLAKFWDRDCKFAEVLCVIRTQAIMPRRAMSSYGSIKLSSAETMLTEGVEGLVEGRQLAPII